ncbi:hypothetical protein ABW22_11405 [Thiobacillus denitrificans]|uniref:Uncharacterized protein n=1 Tax=Thiobacillus denitrificans TaxID=36861 RepID=A0A106BLF4_THIDE|nr:hypothetical protein ABW22_11405 [Thiobacillus denitrificans]
MLQKRFNPFQTLQGSVIVTSGDNDWTDCHRPNNGNDLPTGCLAGFRDINYPIDPADSPYFHVDRPFAGPVKPSGNRIRENVTRVDNFGAQNVHWVEVCVSPRDSSVFRVEPRIVKANVFAR